MAKSEQIERGAELGKVGEATVSPSRAQEMLLEFLRDHDALCPVCGYNLKGLTRPICPECRQELVLTVGAKQLRFGWLLAAVAPGFFSGIAAVFAIMPVVGQYMGDRWLSPAVITFIALDLFGWCSAILAIIIAVKLKRFIAQPLAKQRWWAIIIWIIHIAALGMFILLANLFL